MPYKCFSVDTVVREILTGNLDLSSEDVITRARQKGVTRPAADLRPIINNVRSDMRASKKKKKTKAGAGLRKKSTKPVAAARTAAGSGEAALLAAVALVNKTAQMCGGFARAREIAEAIRACGGIDAFLKRLALVAEILGPKPAF